MAGIYIHIPFCKSRCIYCDFFSTTNESEMNSYVSALCKEMVLRKDELANDDVKTIYFGGGTPSRLNRKHFEQIFETLNIHYKLSSAMEVTVEANPDDLSHLYVDMLCELPFNRLSIGVQSFDDSELKFLSRRHNAKEAIDAVSYCQEKGFANISIDLMYGLPNQNLTIWKHNLEQTLALKIQHISAYHLIYEEKTHLYSLLEADKINPVNEDCSLEMFELLINTLTENGFDHYEISAFAKKGFISQHNSSYWTGLKYLGFGPSAHSFDGNHRWWNVASLQKYMQGISNSTPYIELEDIDLTTKYNEYIITGLRTVWGVDLHLMKREFGNKMYDYFLKNAEKYFNLNYLKKDDAKVTLTRKGIFISDGIMSDLMMI